MKITRNNLMALIREVRNESNSVLLEMRLRRKYG